MNMEIGFIRSTLIGMVIKISAYILSDRTYDYTNILYLNQKRFVSLDVIRVQNHKLFLKGKAH